MPKDSILKGIADNPLLFEAVKEVLVRHFTLNEISTQMTNETMGQVIRARIDGLRMVEDAFREISSYKSDAQVDKITHPGR